MKSLLGVVEVAGDKSISHRAFIIASQMVGRVLIVNVCDGHDIRVTIAALRNMGIRIESVGNNNYYVYGVGVGGFDIPLDSFQMHNSASANSFFLGLVSTYPFISFFSGDRSLSARPMIGVVKPLLMMGAQCFANSDEKFLPIALIGEEDAVPIHYDMICQSAQVKSAMLFAALNIRGTTVITEKEPYSRDHTEIMLGQCGAHIKVIHERGQRRIELAGQEDLLNLKKLEIYGDPSAAAFVTAIALLVRGSDVTIPDVVVNPRRRGFYDIVLSMGGNIRFYGEREEMGEIVADIRIRSSELFGVKVASDMFCSSIDEYPILCILASCAHGESWFKGLSRLRDKESDRISVMVDGLCSCGVFAIGDEDSIMVKGAETIKGGVEVDCMLDHRVAMSFLVLNLVAEREILVKDRYVLSKSYPGIIEVLRRVGCSL